MHSFSSFFLRWLCRRMQPKKLTKKCRQLRTILHSTRNLYRVRKHRNKNKMKCNATQNTSCKASVCCSVNRRISYQTFVMIFFFILFFHIFFVFITFYNDNIEWVFIAFMMLIAHLYISEGRQHLFSLAYWSTYENAFKMHQHNQH